MKPRKRTPGLLAAILVAFVALASCQPAASVDGLPTTDDAPPPSSASPATSMPVPAKTATATRTTAAPPSAATAAAPPAPATPSALAAPVDRVVFRTVATCSSLVQLPRPTPSPPTASSSPDRSPPPPPKLSVRSLNATLEMDATPSYSSVWRGRDGNEGGWRPGKSRLNVSAVVSGVPTTTAARLDGVALSARLHPLPCLPDGVSMFGPMAYGSSTAYRHGTGSPGGGGEGSGEEELVAEVSGLSVEHGSGVGGSPPRVSGSSELPFLVDYDSAGSVVLYAEGGTGSDGRSSAAGGWTPPPPIPLACCSLSPPPPDFPDEWSAVIEANVRDKGYSMVVRQLYSSSNRKVRLDVHSLGNDRVVVQDYSTGKATFIDAPNSTHPRGACDVVRFDEMDAPANAAAGAGAGDLGGAASRGDGNVADDGSAPVAAGFSSAAAAAAAPPPSGAASGRKRSGSSPSTEASASFLPTAAALAFAPGGGAARARFVPSASFDVRGIPVETWHRRVDEPTTNSSYDLLYFFPVNAWLASGEQYHRMLKAIVVNGTQAGQRVYQEFHFVDFRPYGGGNGTAAGIPPEAFDPCEIAPGGAGCGCESRKNKGKAPADAARDFGTFAASASPVPSGGGAVGPAGFLPSQVGAYVFFLFLGLVAGLLGVFGIPALVSCCCSGRKRSFGRFEEGVGGAPTSAVTSAA